MFQAELLVFCNFARDKPTHDSYMIKQICRTILYKWLGWTADVTLPIPDKCIFAVAPHTSNLDFILGELYIRTTGKKASFLMKKEWFFWPLGLLLKGIGGIPVNRSKRTSMTDQLQSRRKEHALKWSIGKEVFIILPKRPMCQSCFSP